MCRLESGGDAKKVVGRVELGEIVEGDARLFLQNGLDQIGIRSGRCIEDDLQTIARAEEDGARDSALGLQGE